MSLTVVSEPSRTKRSPIVIWRWSFGVLADSLVVVDGAQAASVALDGEPAFAVGLDVVDVALGGGDIAAGGVLAVPVTDFDGAA